jgi:hypothetical protein
MNQQDYNDQLNAIISAMKADIKKAAEDAISDAYSDILPYIVSDTEMNAMCQAADIVQSIIAGRFEFDGNYIVVEPAREFSPRVRLEFTTQKYDALRDAIIAKMPKCPKDAKIKQLEETINDMSNWR